MVARTWAPCQEPMSLRPRPSAPSFMLADAMIRGADALMPVPQIDGR